MRRCKTTKGDIDEKGGQAVLPGGGVTSGRGGGYALFFVDPPPQTGGTVAVGPIQGSKDEQLWIGTYIPLVSLGLAQPFPTSILTFDPEDGVNVGPGNVMIVPVGV